METKGFYKFFEGELTYAPNFVHSPTYSLSAKSKDQYEYPVDGWYWFDNEESAKAFFGIEIEIENAEIIED